MSYRRKPLHRLSLAVLAALSPALVQAQTAEPTVPQATALDAVQVTGSRIKRATLEGQVPVLVVDRAAIERSGHTSISDLVQQMTGSGSALNAKFNSSGNFGFPPDGSGVGAGSAQVDLRHLGAKRVLVLVDGMRWVNESSASGVGAATDLNTIPLAIVDRIEVLQDGASSLYGSDAIAGVVNIITRRDASGAQVSLDWGQYGEGDGTRRGIDLSWGHSDERRSVFVGASYTRQDAVYARDREQSRWPVPGTGLALGSSATPDGRFIFIDPNSGQAHDITPNAGVANPQYDAGAGCARSDDYHCFGTADRFNFAQYNLLMTPSERKGVFGQFRQRLGENVEWTTKVLYNRRESTNQAAPEPIFLGPEAGTGNPLADNIVISALNPYNPFGFALDSASNLVMIGRRPVEGGARVFEQEVDTQYIGTGLSGAIQAGQGNWYWDVNAAWSRNKAEQANYGSYNILAISQALGDPAACAAIAGCVPLDIFGGAGSITPAMLGFIQPMVRDRSQNELQQVSASLSGELGQLPGGAVGMAVGAEYRRYEGWYRPDALTVAGHYNGVPSLPTSGSYHVSEAFVELGVPLLGQDAHGQSLDLSLAGRYSTYSTFGGEFTPKVGLRWQPAEDLVLRASYAEGFRAPSIGELYGSAARADLQLSDPCSVGLGGSAPRGNAANCTSLGVPAGYQQANSQISVTTGGNGALEPERSRSVMAGMVWSPWFANGQGMSERFDLALTFYRHTVDGAIQAIDAQTQLDLCVDTLDATYCDGITRAATGGINGFNNRLTNLGQISTDGWDLDMNWVLAGSGGSKLVLGWQNTFVGSYRATGAAGQVQPQGPGIEVVDSAIPEWTSTLRVDWSRGDWSLGWSVRHLSELREDCGDAVAFAVCGDPLNSRNTLDATTYHDLRAGYRWATSVGDLGLTLGINNVFDTDPPICLSCSLNGYDASTYDIPGGRFGYLRVDWKF